MHPTVAPNETTNLLPSADNAHNESLGKQPFRIYVVVAMSAIGGFLFGYDTGIVSGAMLYIGDHFELSPVWKEWVVSSTVAAAWIASIISGRATDKFGRRPVILFSSIVFVVGSLVMAVSWTKWVLIAGRLIVGAGVGFASMTAPMYIAELAPASCRGKLLLIFTSSITGGAFIAAFVAFAFSFTPDWLGWRLMLGVAALPAAIQLVAFALLPESPRWLVANGRLDEALLVLRKLRNKDADVEAEFVAICKSNANAKREKSDLLASINLSHATNYNNYTQIDNSRSTNSRRASTASTRTLSSQACLHQSTSAPTDVSVFRRILSHESCRLALLVGCLLQLTQQFAGINTIMYYSAEIIKESGVKPAWLTLLLAAVLAFINFVGTMAGYLFVERAGRRKLTLVSLGGVAVSLACIGAGFHLKQTRLASYSPIVILASMVMYLCFFSPGMGPMPWTINSEIYPSWARSFCMSATTSTNWISNLLVSMTFLTLQDAITSHGAYYLYAAYTACAFVFFVIMLPETRGKSLEQLENLFAAEQTQLKQANQADSDSSSIYNNRDDDNMQFQTQNSAPANC